MKRALTLSVVYVALACGQTLNLQPLERLSSKAKETVNVTLDGSLLQMAAKFLSSDDPQQAKARQLVNNLKGIYVRSYEFKDNNAYSKSDIEAVRVQLKGATWSRIVDVQSSEDAELSEVYIQRDRGNIAGVAVLVAGPKELTVIQIVGPIDLDSLSQLGGQMGIPNLRLDAGKKKTGGK